MARTLRNLVTNEVYHVVCKGNNRDFLLKHDADKAMFLETVKRYRKLYDFELYAYCILDNHVHLLIKMGSTSLSRVMQGISQSFTQRFNRKYDRSGHVFEGRYFCSVCLTTHSIMRTLAYIHLNPYKAGKCMDLDYFWSSHFAYSRNVGEVWFDSLALLKRLKDKVQWARKIYREYMVNFRNEPVFFEYHDTDVVQEPMTIEVLEKKIRVNRRFRALDFLLERAKENLGNKVCAEHASTKVLTSVLVWLNRKLGLISNAELARRLKVRPDQIRKILIKEQREWDRLDGSWGLGYRAEIDAYLNIDKMRLVSEVCHLNNLESALLEVLRLFKCL